MSAESKALRESVIGLKITEMRAMTEEEWQEEGWDYGTIVLVLEDGTKIYPSQDEEGNGPGALFGMTKEGRGIQWHA